MTTPPRPDQETDPPAMVISPGGNAGVFRGRLVIVNGVTAPPGSGIFVYNASGALIGSWAGTPGTDPVDHQAVQLGLTVQNAAATVQSNLQSGSLTLTKLSGVLAPPSISVQDDTLNTGNTPSVVDTTGVLTSLVTTYDPVLLDGTVETWHNFGSLAIAGWTVAVAQYRMLADSGCVAVRIQNLAPSTHPADATQIWAAANGLPAPYRPTVNTRIACYSQATGAEAPALEFETTGAIQIFGIGGTTTTRLDLYTTAIFSL